MINEKNPIFLGFFSKSVASYCENSWWCHFEDEHLGKYFSRLSIKQKRGRNLKNGWIADQEQRFLVERKVS